MYEYCYSNLGAIYAKGLHLVSIETKTKKKSEKQKHKNLC